MTDELDGNLPSGTPSAPTESGSQGGDSGGSFDPRELQKALDAFKKQIEEIDARTKALQGDKDRGIKKTEREMDVLKRQIAELEMLKKRGLGEDEAFEELGFRQAVRDFKQSIAARNVPSGNGDEKAVNAESLIAEYGLDVSSPEVKLAFEGKQFRTEIEVKAAIADLMKPKPTPTLAQMPARPSTPISDDADVLKRQYEKAISAAGRGNIKAISDIQAEFRKKGLSV